MTKAECDHATCWTPFCPHCGQDIRSANPLVGLLRHCEAQARRMEQWEQDKQSYSPGFDPAGKRAGKLRANTQRWQSWANALKAVLDADKPAK